MREILFRGKTLDGRWVYGYYVRTIEENDDYSLFEKHWIYDVEGWFRYEVLPETVGQCTGLKDKNGVKIFEGDIATHKDYECYGYVVFSDDESAFAFLVVTGSNNKGPTTEFEWLYEYADGLEVIGNIHDNPELMEVTE